MPKFKFRLRGSNPDKPQSINLVIFYKDNQLVWATGQTTYLHNWDSKMGEVITPKSVRKKLVEILSFAERLYTQLERDELEISNSVLREALNLEFRKVPIIKQVDIEVTEYVVPFFQMYIDDCKSGKILKRTKQVSSSLIKSYNTALKHLSEFEKFNKRKIKFIHLDKSFHSKLIKYMEEEKGLAAHTMSNVVKNLKMVCNFAKDSGLEVNAFVFSSGFYKPKTDGDEVKPIYLNEDEINLVFKKDFCWNERLDNVRDLFIIGLWTGLRIGDFKRLTKENIKDGFIRIKQSKTGGEVVIPIHPQVQSTLDKRGGELPMVISDQKFNYYLKDVAMAVGFKEVVEGSKTVMDKETGIKRKKVGMYQKFELITSHVCRRSFATNHYGKLPNLSIMAITGHRTEKTFLHYIKTTPDEHALALKNVWIGNEETELEKALREIEELKKKLKNG